MIEITLTKFEIPISFDDPFNKVTAVRAIFTDMITGENWALYKMYARGENCRLSKDATLKYDKDEARDFWDTMVDNGYTMEPDVCKKDVTD